MKNPFRVEDARHILATQKRIGALKKLYTKNYAEIKDLNTGTFWDERIDAATAYEPEDGMTKHRIRIVYNFIPQHVTNLLDIGAGYGYIERLISQKGRTIKLYGNDISPNAVKQLQRRFKGDFRVESLYRLRYPAQFFDLVMLLEVLEHVPPTKTFALLKRIKQLLKPGGYIIISVPSNEGLEQMKGNPNGHTRTYTRELIKAELEAIGFTIKNVKTLHAFSNLYTLKSIIARFFPKRWKVNNIIVLAQLQ